MSELKLVAGAAVALLIVGGSIQFAVRADKQIQAAEALSHHGIKPNKIKMGFLGCSESDGFNFYFEGTDALGDKVTGHVCSGFFKGATVRFE
jgi:hypothetical protein